MATKQAEANVETEEKTEDKTKSKQNQSATEESEEVETTVTLTKPQKTTKTSVEIQRELLANGKVEETKITTINTLINGKIEDSKVKKETRILSDEEAKDLIQEESEEEEEVIEEEQETSDKKTTTVKHNGNQEVNINASHTDSKKSTTTVKSSEETKVTTEKSGKISEEVETEEEEEFVEETESEHEEEVVDKISTSQTTNKEEIARKIESNEKYEKRVEEQEVIGKAEISNKIQSGNKISETENVIEITTHESDEEVEEEEEEVEEEEEIVEEKVETKLEEKADTKSDSTIKKEVQIPKNEEKVVKEINETTSQETTVQPDGQSIEIHVQKSVTDKETVQKKTSFSEIKTEKSTPSPIPETETTTTKNETTEIFSSDIPIGKPMSTQTELQRIENIITVNKTSKILDNSYEQLTQQGVPTVKTYFPPTREKIPPVSPPSKPYTPNFPVPAEKKEERRHSLLLERISTERQFASPDSYHNTYNYTSSQNHEHNTNQWSQEPQSEVVVSSNVKPSSLKTNSQWYQNSQQQTQSNQENSTIIYNNINAATPVKSISPNPQQTWSQPTFDSTPNAASTHQKTGTNLNLISQPSGPQPSPYDCVSNSAPIYKQPINHSNLTSQPAWPHPTYDNNPYSAPTYQHPEQQNYSTVPKPSSWGSNNIGNLDRIPSINAQSNQYSFLSNKKSTENCTNQYNTQLQHTTGTNLYNTQAQQITGTKNYSTGYVPPPWETEKTAYQPSPFYEPQSAPISSSTAPPMWNSPAPTQAPKKSAPLSYVPPAPNASFVKQVSPAPQLSSAPGRKTYYSEYERRYISVPETTYVPPETKVQPQWDASPQYYYDNVEPSEQVELPWRKELREFTEKSTKEETTIVQPPWKNETTFSKETTASYSNQPSWSQTLRPRSYREKSYESESLQQSQEWPRVENKRPLSTYARNRIDSSNVGRTRGVSVDRYNSNSYQSPNTFQPSTHAPSSNNNYTFSWESQEQITTTNQNNETQTITSAAKGYHNPQVPGYHVRSNESQDYQVSYTPRWSGQGRERPVQSRSFKYLQMLTGTEDGEQEPEPFVVQQPHHAVPKPRRV